MALIISDTVLEKAQISADDLLVEIACYLYARKKLSMGLAKELAGLNQIEFQQALSTREIDLHYSAEDLETDLKNLGINL